MAQLSTRCPYCETEAAGFSGSSYVQKSPQSLSYNLFMQCGVCGECIIAQFRDPTFRSWVLGQANRPVNFAVFPRQTRPNSPAYLPDNIDKFFQQGTDAYTRGNFDSAGMMFRKALDCGLKALAPGAQGSLQKRIDAIPDELGMTPSMKKWAHEIRRLGNEAAHEDELFTESDAADLRAFVDLFLTYAFTLPAMLERRKASGTAKQQ